MGNVRRIAKAITPKIALVDAHVSVNGCQVFLGSQSPKKATETAQHFKAMLGNVMYRSKFPNVHDLYEASRAIHDKITLGESIWN